MPGPTPVTVGHSTRALQIAGAMSCVHLRFLTFMLLWLSAWTVRHQDECNPKGNVHSAQKLFLELFPALSSSAHWLPPGGPRNRKSPQACWLLFAALWHQIFGRKQLMCQKTCPPCPAGPIKTAFLTSRCKTDYDLVQPKRLLDQQYLFNVYVHTLPSFKGRHIGMHQKWGLRRPVCRVRICTVPPLTCCVQCITHCCEDKPGGQIWGTSEREAAFISQVIHAGQ